MRWVDWMYLMKSAASSCGNTVADDICSLVWTHWMETPRHEVSECIMLRHFNVFHSYHKSPRWTLSLPSPGSCAGHCVHQWQCNVFSWPGPRLVVVVVSCSLGLSPTSQDRKSSLSASVMDTQHHILITDKENVHQPIRTIILLQCLLMLTLFYP